MQQSGHNILLFSINNSNIDQSFIEQSIRLFLQTNHTNAGAILIADTLRTNSFQVIDRMNEAKARAKCIELGDSIAKIIKDYLNKQGISLPIWRWDALFNDENYKKIYKECSAEFNKDPKIKEAFHEIALEHLKGRSKDKTWLPKHVEASSDFLIQETPSYYQVEFEGKMIEKIYYPTNQSLDKYNRFMWKLADAQGMLSIDKKYKKIPLVSILLDKESSYANYEIRELFS